MNFCKMQGIGNDYVFVECIKRQVSEPQRLAREISDRHFGVGSDGMILIMPSDVGDVGMRIFNADGSEAEMCGNGIRCLAKYAYEHNLARKNPMRVETKAGIRIVELEITDDDKVAATTVDMGKPITDPAKIPVNIPQRKVVDTPLRTSANVFKMTCVSMGNPHAVIYVDDVSKIPLGQLGPEIENNPLFARRTNVHFVRVAGPHEATMRTWERGSGPTMACGTGAAAVCVAGVLCGKTDREILIHLPGGDLKLNWDENSDHVFMTGPAEEVFTGKWNR